MTEKEYRQHPAISRSELWRMHESPEKFKYYRDNPPEPTPALLFGQVVHKLLLQPEDFDNDFVVAPDIDRRTKAGKEQWSDFLDHIGMQQVITQDMYDQARDMVTAVTAAPMVATLLNGQREVPFFWTDEDTCEECKCRVDCLTRLDGDAAESCGLKDGTMAVIDYKTTRNAKIDIFNNEIYRYGYHFQAAMYSEGVMKASSLTERPAFIFVAQEKYPPYSVNIVVIPPDVMLAGDDVFRQYLGMYHECKETGYWYGYNGPFDQAHEAYLPGWMQLGVESEEDE